TPQINRAFASIGIIESSLFITDKYNVSTPAEIGVPSPLGASYGGADIGPSLPMVLGSSIPMLTFDGASASLVTAGTYAFGGSLYSNADLLLHGVIQANLNTSLGDQWTIAGNIEVDQGASVSVTTSKWDNGWTNS